MSYERTINAIKEGKFLNEICPVEVSDKETVTEDEEHKKYIREKIPLLRPAFSKTGTITAGNASKLNDAGCGIVLMSEEKVKEHKLNPLARIVSYADAETEPIDFCIAPATAV
jgi:acetyl-CoA C-acetyltransferase